MKSLLARLCRAPRPRLFSSSLGLLLVLALSAPGLASAGVLVSGGAHAGEDHSFEDHSNEFLRWIDLRDANLFAIDLSGADLKNATLDRADLRDALLEDAMLKYATFVDALLNGADLVGADIKNADFRGAMLLGADLSIVIDGGYADFDGAWIDDDTLLDPSIDTTGMKRVMGPCPDDPDAMLVEDDGAYYCKDAQSLPEPGGMASLLAGALSVFALGRRRLPSVA